MIGRLAALALAPAILAGAAANTPPAEAVRAAPEPQLVNPTPLSSGDFNGDGRADLAIGVPREDSSNGAVAVVYATASGLRVNGNQLWTQASPGISGVREQDGFGWATATGDFDGDGYDDLAIGAPLETLIINHAGVIIFGRSAIVDGRLQAGAVNVLYGTPNGLSAQREQVWHQGRRGIKGRPQTGDFFGAALAAGDFDGDGRDDLAIGAPGENKGAGAVHVLRGASGGLSRIGDQLWLQSSSGVDDSSERGDGFGGALAAGNLGYSSKEADLAVGIPGEDVGSVEDAGAVAILHGQPDKGLTATIVPDRFVHQNAAGVDDAAERRDHFGAALAIGDFGRTAQGDLAVGVPGESLAFARQGAVQVLYGGSAGVDLADDQLWSAGAGGLAGAPQAAAELGRALAAGDLNGSAYADLAIGVPYQRDGDLAGAGAVHVVNGSPAGLAVTGSVVTPPQLWTRATLPSPFPGVPPGTDLFGYALADGRFGPGSGASLATSAPNASSLTPSGVPCCPGAGLVHVIARSGTSLGTTGNQTWSQFNLLEEPESGDRFGGG
jgi:hypothetical protein